MKKILLIGILLMSYSLTSFAYVSTTPLEKVYSFKFKMNSEKFEYSQKSDSYEEAFEKAAKACFQHFRGTGKLSEERGLDIIDICANPRST